MRSKKILPMILILAILIGVGAYIVLSNMGDKKGTQDTSTDSQNTSEVEETEQPEETDNPMNNEPEVITPDWYNKQFSIDTSELAGTGVETINVWPSYDDRSKVITKLANKEKVTLIGYDKENDYCKIKTIYEGWISCDFLVGLPSGMESYSK